MERCDSLKDPTVIPHLMSLLSNSQRTQEYITQIFSHCCKVFDHTQTLWSRLPCSQTHNRWLSFCLQTPEHQTLLFNHGAIQNIAPLLISSSYKVGAPPDRFPLSPLRRSPSFPPQVRMQALKCFSVLAYENTLVSMTLVNGELDSCFFFSVQSFSSTEI